MGEVLKSGDLLRYGIGGLALLLMVVTAIILLTLIASREKQTSAMFSLIKLFMVLTVVVILIVAVFSLWLVPQNTQLRSEVVEKSQQIDDTNDTLKALKTTAILSEQIASGVKANADEINQQADTLAAYVTRTVPADQQEAVLQRIDSLKQAVAQTPVNTASDSVALQLDVRNQLFKIQRQILVRPNYIKR